ncbi:MAG: high-affinity nickel-transporter [Desulfovibrionaceae bacterium]|jgi:ABC-type nickel/cobalt efflux system permease component RcnA|nr:high-affinity nickel-transporter [Desulfovibrionaceae bacterium]
MIRWPRTGPGAVAGLTAARSAPGALPLPLALVALLLAAALLAFAPAPARAQANPFVSARPVGAAPPRHMAGLPTFLRPALAALVQVQAELRTRMADMARDVREHPAGASFWLFLLCAFGYGVVHALGPGHGKLFAASYFLHRPGGLRQALAYGNLAMLTHVLSATTLVGAGYLLLRISSARAGAAATPAAPVDVLGPRLELASYALLFLLGAGMTALTLRGLLRRGPVDDGAGDGARPDTATSSLARRGLAATAVASGIVPCPGATLVLTFSLALGIPLAGFLAMGCIALGMGITVSAVALAVIASRGAALGLARTSGRARGALHAGLALAGSLAMTALGGLLLLGAL